MAGSLTVIPRSGTQVDPPTEVLRSGTQAGLPTVVLRSGTQAGLPTVVLRSGTQAGLPTEVLRSGTQVGARNDSGVYSIISSLIANVHGIPFPADFADGPREYPR